MTQEEKQLLLKDLCARLPYGVKMKYKDEEGASTLCQIDTFYTDVDGFHGLIRTAEPPRILYDLTEFKPYLRPMSSMTEEEKKEWHYLYLPLPHDNEATEAQRRIDWLNAHQFDYRGLLPKKLALNAKEGMYKTE